MRTYRLASRWWLGGILCGGLVAAGAIPPAMAATFVVNSTADVVDATPGDASCATGGGACTLRAAVQEANALSGADAITLPAGTYLFTLAGAGENAAATGDLDVTQALAITGAGAANTIIDANGLGRAFELFTGLSLSGATIRGGNASGDGSCLILPYAGGGGICGLGIFTDVVIEQNSSAWGGGVFGAGIFTRCTIRNNTSTTYQGGGIAAPGGGLTLIDSTVSGNTGTGIYTFEGGGMTLRNTTVSGNGSYGIVNTGGCDGPMFCSPATMSTLSNVTVANNGSGGIYAQILDIPSGMTASPMTMSNTLLAGNNGADCIGNVTSGGYNLMQSSSCTIDGDLTGNVIGVNPNLGPLASNGGATQTHAIGATSAAYNAGNPAVPGSGIFACETADQRGIARPVGPACDIGAYEDACGNGSPDPGEVCDDGDQDDGDGCDSNCTPTACGNGVVTAGEECDDGNGTAGDGCETDCTFTPVCVGGTTINRPRIVLRRLGAPAGNEQLVFTGRLVFADGMPPDFSPPADGAQLLIEDLGSGGSAVLALTYRTTPVPPGLVGGGCDPSNDGWHSNLTLTRFLYKNRSNAIDPETCTAASALGLRILRLVDRRSTQNEIRFVARARNATLSIPVGPLRGTLVLGASVSASAAGSCGSHSFLAGDCTFNASGTTMVCE